MESGSKTSNLWTWTKYIFMTFPGKRKMLRCSFRFFLLAKKGSLPSSIFEDFISVLVRSAWRKVFSHYNLSSEVSQNLLRRIHNSATRGRHSLPKASERAEWASQEKWLNRGFSQWSLTKQMNRSCGSISVDLFLNRTRCARPSPSFSVRRWMRSKTRASLACV